MQEHRNAATAVTEVARGAKVVVQTADVRIVEYTLRPGDGNPWHYHSHVSDRVYCLQGLIAVGLQQPPKRLVLRPGESYEISPKAVHYVSNAGDDTSRYLLIQALGKYDFVKAG